MVFNHASVLLSTTTSFQCGHTSTCMPNVSRVYLQVPQGKWKLNRSRNTTCSISSSTITTTTTTAAYKNEVPFFWKCKQFCYRESESCAKPYVPYTFFFGLGWFHSQKTTRNQTIPLAWFFILKKNLLILSWRQWTMCLRHFWWQWW